MNLDRRHRIHPIKSSKKEKKSEKSEDSFWNLGDYSKPTNIYVIGIPEEETEKPRKFI